MLINILIFISIALGITVAALITLFCVAAAVRSSQLSKQEEDEIDFGRDDIWWLNEADLDHAVERNLYRTLSH